MIWPYRTILDIWGTQLEASKKITTLVRCEFLSIVILPPEPAHTNVSFGWVQNARIRSIMAWLYHCSFWPFVFVQVPSKCDFSTNFCNMFNLFCNEASVLRVGLEGRSQRSWIWIIWSGENFAICLAWIFLLSWYTISARKQNIWKKVWTRAPTGCSVWRGPAWWWKEVVFGKTFHMVKAWQDHPTLKKLRTTGVMCSFV